MLGEFREGGFFPATVGFRIFIPRKKGKIMRNGHPKNPGAGSATRNLGIAAGLQIPLQATFDRDCFRAFRRQHHLLYSSENWKSAKDGPPKFANHSFGWIIFARCGLCLCHNNTLEKCAYADPYFETTVSMKLRSAMPGISTNPPPVKFTGARRGE